MPVKPITLTEAFDRLAVAEISLYECEQNWKSAHEETGRALRREREAKGLSLRKVANELGCSAPFISDCELGRHRLSPEMLNRYRTILQYA